MLIEKRKREFSNGTVYALLTEDGYPLEFWRRTYWNYIKSVMI